MLMTGLILIGVAEPIVDIFRGRYSIYMAIQSFVFIAALFDMPFLSFSRSIYY
jgi:hypothetical protein